MGAAELETRPLYGIGTVARLTRVRPETLRIWERRYGLGASHKSEKGRRLYTQTDLEHLQIVVRLVEQGYRIGEIAAMERKTLEAIIEQAGVGRGVESGAARPRVLFIGGGLCAWLDQHPGCLSGLDSKLWRGRLEDWNQELEDQASRTELVVVECGALNEEQVTKLRELKEHLQAGAMQVFYQFSNQRWLGELEKIPASAAKLPLETQMFASNMRQMLSSVEIERGVSDAGDLAAARPRLFSEAELATIQQAPAAIECGCSQHLSGIIQSLSHFEEYSSNCSVEGWRDAATHAVVYAYTNQARWLMEKALQTVMEEHANEKNKGPDQLSA